jgi:hypothetical protein
MWWILSVVDNLLDLGADYLMIPKVDGVKAQGKCCGKSEFSSHESGLRIVVAGGGGARSGRWLRLPSLPVLIGAGMALNLAGLLPGRISLGGGRMTSTPERRCGFWSSAGVPGVRVGVELNPRRFAKRGATVAWVGGVQFGFPR